MKILVINCGSSSLKYRLFDMRNQGQLAWGLIERIGEPMAAIHHQAGEMAIEVAEPILDYAMGVRAMLRLLTRVGEAPPLAGVQEIAGVGHRVVHGGEQFHASAVIDDQVVSGIEAVAHLAPLHNPAHLAGIRAAKTFIPDCPHVAVFDTAFFQTMPPASYIYALPYDWYIAHGIRRYGFHGTSHRYVSMIAADVLGKPEPNLVTLHLGNGCSATAIREGKAVDQSMGLTPLEGLMMGTRCGDIDPAIIFHLHRQGLSMQDIHNAVEKQGGLLGISGVSRDMRDVHAAAEAGNERAALAIDVFAHRVRKYLGAFMVAVGRCDAVIFTGGIGEGAVFMRAKILEGLEPLGIVLDPARNADRAAGPLCITAPDSRIAAWVIPTNEELMIARDTVELIANGV